MNTFRKFLLGIGAAALLAVAGVALAQSITLPYVTSIGDTDAFQDVVGGQPNAQSRYTTGTLLRAYIFGSQTLHTGTPVLTSCITGSGTIVGTDYAFILTGGSTASTSCVATFAVAYTSTPVCTVSSQTAYGTTTASFAVSTTAVTITQASGSSNVYDVICVARPGG